MNFVLNVIVFSEENTIENQFLSLCFTLQDVFILDAKSELFVWIGKKTSMSEKKNAMSYAHVSLMFFIYQVCNHHESTYSLEIMHVLHMLYQFFFRPHSFESVCLLITEDSYFLKLLLSYFLLLNKFLKIIFWVNIKRKLKDKLAKNWDSAVYTFSK